jgi:hypothetical protein
MRTDFLIVRVVGRWSAQSERFSKEGRIFVRQLKHGMEAGAHDFTGRWIPWARITMSLAIWALSAYSKQMITVNHRNLQDHRLRTNVGMLLAMVFYITCHLLDVDSQKCQKLKPSIRRNLCCATVTACRDAFISWSVINKLLECARSFSEVPVQIWILISWIVSDQHFIQLLQIHLCWKFLLLGELSWFRCRQIMECLCTDVWCVILVLSSQFSSLRSIKYLGLSISPHFSGRWCSFRCVR